MKYQDQIAESIRMLADSVRPHQELWYQTWSFWSVIIPVLIGLVTYVINKINARRRFRHEISMQCIQRYREIFKTDNRVTVANVYPYLDMVNEQLFYFKKNYICKGFVDEWMREMLTVLPFFVKQQGGPLKIYNLRLLESCNSIFVHESFRNKLLAYPNIRKLILFKPNSKLPELNVFESLAESLAKPGCNDRLIRLLIARMKLNLKIYDWSLLSLAGYKLGIELKYILQIP